MTGNYLNTGSLGHIDADVLFSTFGVFRRYWLAAFLLFTASCLLFSLAARKAVRCVDLAGSRKMVAVAVFALSVPLCLPEGILHNVYTIARLKSVKSAGFTEAIDSFGSAPSGYVKRGNLAVSADNPKNIIVIALESFEKAFLDRAELTPYLNELTQRWSYYDNYSSAVGTMPTITALYSLLTGLPYEFTGESVNSVFKDRAVNSEFVSLPVVLKQAGYVLEYVAANPDFAGTSDLLRSLDFDRIKGYSSDVPQGQPLSSMGLFDKDVFSLAKSEHGRLVREGKPFFLYIATVGTHFPMYNVGDDPRIPEQLKSVSGDKQEYIIRWTDALVGDFVEYLEELVGGGMDDTLVVIVPDHIGYQKPFPDTTQEKRALFLLASATSGDVEAPLTHYSMQRFLLDAAGIETNACFFNDFFLDDVHEPSLSKKIKDNLPQIAMLNGSILESNRKGIVITRDERLNEFTFDFGAKKTSITLNSDKLVIVTPLSHYGEQSAAYVFADYFQSVRNYLLALPCLLVVPGDGKFQVVLNPFSVFTKVYETQGGSIIVPVDDVEEVFAWRKKFPTDPIPTFPQYDYGFQSEPMVVLSLVSANYAGLNTWKPGVSLKGPLATTGLGFGLTLVTARPTGMTYSTFDVGAGDEYSVRFLTALGDATESDHFFAVVSCGSLWGFPEKFSKELQGLGFPLLAGALPDEPYIAFRKEDGSVTELRPGLGTFAPSLSALTASIALPKKQVSPNLVYYDNDLSARIKEKEKLGYRNFLYNDNNRLSNTKAYIAHGGGAIEGKIYTNSYEAVLRAVENGFTFIELDLLQTADGHIVAAHDWGTFNRITGHPEDGDAPLTLNEFMSRKIYDIYTPLSEDGIVEIFSENPELFLITDKIRDYPDLAEAFPFTDRLIVEVFSPQEYLAALDAGIRYPAYNMHGPGEVNLAGAFGFALTTASGAVWDGQNEALRFLHSRGTAIMQYEAGRPVKARFDTAEFFQENFGETMSMYYSDFWNPGKEMRTDE